MTRDAAALALLLVMLASDASAHEGLHEQIARASERIAREPGNAVLVLQRGELHRLHGDWKHAERDYGRARSLDPGLTTVDLCRGLLSLDRRRGTEASGHLRRYVEANPQDERGYRALARALSLSGRTAAAVEAYEAAIVRNSNPDPDLLLEHVHALAAARGPEEALRRLDALQADLGPLVALQLAAIDLELGAGRYEKALERIEAAARAAVRKETWLERKADVLARAGRETEARLAYRSALEALIQLPPERRFTRAMQRMEARLRQAIK